MDTEKLLKHRMRKFRKLGGFEENAQVDPKKKVNMKKEEDQIVRTTPNEELEGEVEKLKQQLLKAKESSSKPPEMALKDMIEKLKKEVYHEYSEAIKAIGLKDRLDMLREEVSKVNSRDQLMNPVIRDKIEKLKDEFNQKLAAAPNRPTLQYKLDMLKEFSKAKSFSDVDTLKQEVNKKFNEIMSRPEINEKLEALKAEVQNSDSSIFADLDQGLKDKVLNMRKEVELEMISALKSLGLDVEVVKSNAKVLSEKDSLSVFKNKVDHLNEEINKKIENVVSSSELKNMIELLKLEIARAGNKPDTESKSKIEAVQKEIKQRLSEAIISSELKEKYEELKEEISEVEQSSAGADESLQKETKYEEPRLEINLGANSSFAQCM